MVQLTIRTQSNVAAVALANRLARMDWAVLTKNGPVGPQCWSAQLQNAWPAEDAWLRPGLEIAFAIPTSTDQVMPRLSRPRCADVP